MAFLKHIEEITELVNEYKIVNIDGTLYKECPICRTLNYTPNLKCTKGSCNYEFASMNIARERATQFTAEHLSKRNVSGEPISVSRLDKRH